MSLGKTFPRFSLNPEVEHLPDGRRAYTRFREIAAANQLGNDLLAQLALGALDPYPLFTSGTYGPYLTERKISPAGPQGLTYEALRFEELKATGETQVGGSTRKQLEDGRAGIEANFLQLTSDSFGPGMIGTTTAAGDASAFLLTEEAPDNGTVRQIKRIYVHAGTLQQTDETRNQGKLLLRTITAAKTAPSTPTDYTLITAKVDSPNGFPVYTSTFAKGEGRISLSENVIALGQVKTNTVRYLEADDGTAPDGNLVETSSEEQDGYTLWTKTYLVIEGDGLLEIGSETKNGGKLIIYHATKVNEAPPAPSATIGGTVVETGSSVRHEKYYDAYAKTWAEGEGRISLSENVIALGQVKTNTVRYLTADDGTTPDGDLVETSSDAQDGYTLWTKTYLVIEGDGLLEIGSETRNKGKLVIYHATQVNSAPTAPTATIGGTVVETGSSVRHEKYYDAYAKTWAEGEGRISLSENVIALGQVKTNTVRFIESDDGATPAGDLVETSRDAQDGYTLWTKTYLVIEGDGLLEIGSETRNKGKLVIYHATQVNSAPTAPTATIGGTVVETGSSVRHEKYYDAYAKTWAEGEGRISLSENVIALGQVKTNTVRYLTADDGTTPDGDLVETSSQEEEGYTLWTKTYLVLTADGILENTVEKRNNDKLYLYRIAQVGSAPTAPDATTYGGTVVKTSESVRHERYYDVYTRTWAEGNGEISRDIQGGPGAELNRVRITHLTASSVTTQPTADPWTPWTPAGIIEMIENRDDAGYRIWTVSWIQPVNKTYEKYVEFTYPGRAKAFTEEYGSRTMLDVFKSPPVTALVKASVAVVYSTTDTIGTVSDLWNPTDWAVMRAQWQTEWGFPVNLVEALPGYRTTSDTRVTVTSSGALYAVNSTCLGRLVYGGTTAGIIIEGGPEDPGDNTYTLHVQIDPAFTAYDGTKYYRRMDITADIPAQADLPI